MRCSKPPKSDINVSQLPFCCYLTGWWCPLGRHVLVPHSEPRYLAYVDPEAQSSNVTVRHPGCLCFFNSISLV